jgi:hypothetical protein
MRGDNSRTCDHVGCLKFQCQTLLNMMLLHCTQRATQTHALNVTGSDHAGCRLTEQLAKLFRAWVPWLLCFSHEQKQSMGAEARTVHPQNTVLCWGCRYAEHAMTGGKNTMKSGIDCVCMRGACCARKSFCVMRHAKRLQSMHGMQPNTTSVGRHRMQSVSPTWRLSTACNEPRLYCCSAGTTGFGISAHVYVITH